MMRTLEGSRLTRRLLPLTTGFVVALFVSATLYSETLLNDDVDAIDIASNSAPSVAELATARGELRALGAAAQRVVEASSSAEAQEARRAYDGHRHVLAVALGEYRRTPDYPGEWQAYGTVLGKLARVDGIVGHDGATVADLDLALDDLDAALHALSDLNRGYLDRAAAAVLQKARRRNRYAGLLDAIGIVAAFVATVLAVRTVERYLAILARRSRELDHLAIEVAHEIAAPLTLIEVALGRGDSDDERHDPAAARARRGVQRIRSSVERLGSFAAAARPPEAPAAHTPLAPALAAATLAAGLDPADVDSALSVRCSEPALHALLHDLFGGATPPGAARLDRVVVTPSGDRVQIAVSRPPSGEGGEAFDPQLRVPGTEHPGLDLRLATVRRLVEACGGRVGVRRSRRKEELWIELPLA